MDNSVKKIPDEEAGTLKYLIRGDTLILGTYICTIVESQIITQALYDVQRKGSLKITYTTQEIAQFASLKLSNSIYPLLHKAVDHLLNCKIILHDAKHKKTEGFVVVTYASYDNGLFSLDINGHVLPYLINPAPPFTKTVLNDMRKFGGMRKSKNFALRLYEIISTWLFLIDDKKMDYVKKYYSLEEIKIRTGLIREVNDQLEAALDKNGITPAALNIAGDLYPIWGDFKRRMLDPAIAEINQTQSMNITYDPKYAGRGKKVLGITFTIKRSQIPQVAEHGENSVQPELTSGNTDLADTVRRMIPYALPRKDIEAIIDAAGGNIDVIRKAYNAVCNYRKSGNIIRSYTATLISAIREDWSDSPVASSNAPSGKPKKRKSFAQSHKEKYGFSNNSYDFDELEKEIVSNY